MGWWEGDRGWGGGGGVWSQVGGPWLMGWGVVVRGVKELLAGKVKNVGVAAVVGGGREASAVWSRPTTISQRRSPSGKRVEEEAADVRPSQAGKT